MILAFALLIAAIGTASAKSVKTTFTVKGACSNCTPRIEKAAKSVSGVSSATWNLKKQQLTLVYDNSKTSEKAVQQAIAKAGYDAGTCTASTKAYNALPACCQYRNSKTNACSTESGKGHHAANTACNTAAKSNCANRRHAANTACNTAAKSNCANKQQTCHSTKSKTNKK